MKSYWIRATGSGTELELREVPVPQPGPGQLLVRVHAAGLNRGELISRRDLHGQAAEARAAGTESAGEVTAVGAGVTGFASGDRVMSTVRGSFAEYVLLDADLAIRVPNAMSWEEAACTTLVFMVVHDMLVVHGHIARGDWVLIAGASSGVGVAAIQTARAFGAQTIGTSGSASKLQLLRKAGLDVGLQTREPDFHDAVMKATDGHGADIAIDAVGGTVFPELLRSMAYEGRLAMVGYVDGVTQSTVDLGLLHANRLAVYGVSATARTRPMRVAAKEAFVRDVMPFFADNTIRTLVDRVYGFADLPAAKARMEADEHAGKIALRVIPG